MAKKNEETGLNEKQLLFCQLFLSEDFFGNGTLAYCKAYGFDPTDVKQYNTARHNASHLLAKNNVSQHINNMLEEGGLNDNHIDKRLLFLINQNEDKSTALAAIREYNKLKQRITDKLEVKGEFDITLKLE